MPFFLSLIYPTIPLTKLVTPEITNKNTKKFLILESLFGFKPEAIPKGGINFLKTVEHRHRLKIKYQKEYNHWVCYDDAQAHN
ncbi:hypothetical protein MAH1_34120 [Sessilibacter sp. MAH1]